MCWLEAVALLSVTAGLASVILPCFTEALVISSRMTKYTEIKDESLQLQCTGGCSAARVTSRSCPNTRKSVGTLSRNLSVRALYQGSESGISVERHQVGIPLHVTYIRKPLFD